MSRQRKRWNGWRITPQDDPYQPSRGNARKAPKPRGIRNDQAKELAALQRAAGERYSGQGLTEAESDAEILRLKR